jgi:hypothetical protein
MQYLSGAVYYKAFYGVGTGLLRVPVIIQIGAAQPTAHETSLLMGATMAISIIEIFLGIFFLLLYTDLMVRIAAVTLVGVVALARAGVLPFIQM